jgi:hypothetical protein
VKKEMIYMAQFKRQLVLNNYWQIHASGIDPYNFHLSLYNRRGELVWESFDSSVGWDGLYGEHIANGLFIWRIETTSILSNQPYVYNGFVTVIR